MQRENLFESLNARIFRVDSRHTCVKSMSERPPVCPPADWPLRPESVAEVQIFKLLQVSV